MTGLDPASEAFLRWLKQSSCAFARSFATKDGKGVELTTIRGVGSDAAALTAAAVAAASSERPLVALFVDMRSTHQLVRTLHAFEAIEGWNLEAHDRTDGATDFQLSIHCPSVGLQSTAIGFGPFLSMPFTRRSGHVAISVWTGGFKNEHHPRGLGPRPRVTFADVPSGMTRTKHDRAWADTEAWTKPLLDESPGPLRKLTFRLA